MTLRIICIDAGNYQGRGADYVNRLYDMVSRNLPEGLEGEFWCFSDRHRGIDRGEPLYHSNIHVFPLPGLGLTGWFNKLALFRRGLFEPGDRIVYLDLDTLITGRLDEIVQYDGHFAACGDFLYPGQLQSAVMLWKAGFGEEIWNEYVWAGRPDVPGGDQVWIQKMVQVYDTLQNLFPGKFVSYKASGGRIPEEASVVCFHGHPRPHEVLTGWVPQVWKIGGLTRADLDSICNTALEQLHANVTANLKFGYPQLEAAAMHDGHAVIIGGGPSINEKVDEIRWRVRLGQTIFALNGAASWCRSREIPVDYHVIVDAKPESIRFVLDEPELLTAHLLASQVDPKLLWKLDAANAIVRLWHSDAPGVENHLPEGTMRIGGGSTVGLSAMVIAAVMGFKYEHLYGYDSSLAEDEHHGYDQPQNASDLIVDVLEEDGTRWRATPWMVQQAQEFQPLCHDLMEHYGVEVITVAGDGLLPHIARTIAANPQPTAADMRARAILSRLPAGPVTGAEIGVFAGDLSERLLQRPDLKLLMVDSWLGAGEDMLNQEDFHARLTQAQQDEYFATTMRRVAPFGDRAVVVRGSSLLAAEDLDDRWLDFVFIDADHAYEACEQDIRAWLPKLKPGGLLCGHDYGNELPGFGVTRAVDDFIEQSGLTLELGDNFTWFVRVPEAARIAAE